MDWYNKLLEEETNQLRVLGQIHNVMPTDLEWLYLQLLLDHVQSLQSFAYLRTVNGITYQSLEKLSKS